MKVDSRGAKSATIWSLVLVGGPTVAYVATGGPLTPGWGLVPAIAFFAVWYALLLLQGFRQLQQVAVVLPAERK